MVVSEHLPPAQREPPSKAAKVQSYSSKRGVPDGKRRARLVAREFRTTNGGSDEFTFSPTSSMAAMKCFLAWAVVCHLFLCALDVKDAFLTVDQQEAVLIETPSWVHLIIESCPRYWHLLKCLPGQRNAAMRWSEHFRSVAERHGFNAFAGMTTIFRHESRTVCLTIHVDDILLVGNVDDIKWFSETFGSIFTMKSSEVVSVSTGGELSYLKKRITLLSHDNEKPNKQRVCAEACEHVSTGIEETQKCATPCQLADLQS